MAQRERVTCLRYAMRARLIMEAYLPPESGKINESMRRSHRWSGTGATFLAAFSRPPALPIALDLSLKNGPGIGGRNTDQLFSQRPAELKVLIVDWIVPVATPDRKPLSAKISI